MNNLREYQKKAVEKMKNGCILCGGVGSGKSRTALSYFISKISLKNIYIITTAKKRDSLEWDKECLSFNLYKDDKLNTNGIKLIIDSWNNIKKYKDVKNSFFIFDEQKLVGYGAWTKTFLIIAKYNEWVLLSATPGDCWGDYMAVFIANGFYKNKTHFQREHAIFDPYSKFPKITKYTNIHILEQHRRDILIDMKYNKKTKRHNLDIICGYDKYKYKYILKNRWNIYDDEPIKETGKLLYLLRKVVNEDVSRHLKIIELLETYNKVIIFYNFNYELDILKDIAKKMQFDIGEWNGSNHQEIPKTDYWVYLVQYSAGAEGWNCIDTNVMIFYSQNYSYKILEQSRGRIDRMNTNFTDLYYYHLKSKASIDISISRALSDKKNFNIKAFTKDLHFRA